MLLIVNSSDQIKISNIKLSEIKAMIESFTIKEEKFINEIYYLNLGVSFNKKQILKFYCVFVSELYQLCFPRE